MRKSPTRGLGADMLTLENLLIFVPTIAILIALPGPDFAIITKISIFDGKKPAQAAAIGVTLGMCIHTILAMLGLSAIVASSALLFSIIKYAGVAYLFYVGISELIKSRKNNNLEAQSLPDDDQIKGFKKTHYFYSGFLTNVLNPKAILYFMVLYPQFLDSSAPIYSQFLEMGIITAAICLAWYLALANIFTRIRVFFTSARCQRWLMRFTGAIFIGFGLKLIAQKYSE